MSGDTVLLWPLFGFFLVCALLAWREAANPKRTAAYRVEDLGEKPLPGESGALTAYRAQQLDLPRIVRSGRRRAIFFGLLSAATLTYILVRSQ